MRWSTNITDYTQRTSITEIIKDNIVKCKAKPFFCRLPSTLFFSVFGSFKNLLFIARREPWNKSSTGKRASPKLLFAKQFYQFRRQKFLLKSFVHLHTTSYNKMCVFFSGSTVNGEAAKTENFLSPFSFDGKSSNDVFINVVWTITFGFGWRTTTMKGKEKNETNDFNDDKVLCLFFWDNRKLFCLQKSRTITFQLWNFPFAYLSAQCFVCKHQTNWSGQQRGRRMENL